MQKMKNLLSIGETAKKLGVTLQTLRNWEKEGRLLPDTITEGRHRYYDVEAIKNIQRDLEEAASAWLHVEPPTNPPNPFYCQNNALFQTRLQHLEKRLMNIPKFKERYNIITAVTGEIGSNSFDHNVGNWPDILGVFFGYNLVRERIVLADRGRGVLASLQAVRPDLANHQEALHVAFTETVTGRAPEHRGNGLKFVRKYVTEYGMELSFQSGNALLTLKNRNPNPIIKTTSQPIRGCLATITF